MTHTDLTTDFAGDPGSPGDPVRGLLEEAAGDPAVGPTLFHFLNKALPYAGVWEAAGKPLFVHVHGYDVTWDMRPHDANRPPTHPADYIERVLAAPPCLRFVANSEETRGRLLKIGVSDSRIVVKPLGVPIGARPAPKPAGGPVKFLFVGRLVDCKGPDLTVEAFADAVGQGLDGELTVAGAGPLAVTCRLIAERRGVADRVRFPGSGRHHHLAEIVGGGGRVHRPFPPRAVVEPDRGLRRRLRRGAGPPGCRSSPAAAGACRRSLPRGPGSCSSRATWPPTPRRCGNSGPTANCGSTWPPPRGGTRKNTWGAAGRTAGSASCSA